METAGLLLDRLAAGRLGEPVLLVGAHPDDETIGFGGCMGRCEDLRVVTVTDGAPRDGGDAAAHGFATPGDYAAARRAELAAALAAGGLPPGRWTGLGVADQGVTAALVPLARRLAGLFALWRPALVITHPCEGGHPDHDGTAFAVAAAATLTGRAGRPAPALAEMTSYHQGPEGRVTGQFLAPAGDVRTVHLSAAEAERKRRMAACHASQAQVLAWFPIGTEAFRPAPAHDFTAPPHAGPLHYEVMGWASGEAWRHQARQAQRALGIAAGP